MRISLHSVGRNFNKQQVFKNLSYEFEYGSSTAILGGNGSGKSTLIKILSYALSPSRGELEYFNSENKPIKKEEVPFKISMASPYFELIEELTAKEFLNFYRKFKNFKEGIETESILKIAYLESSADKEIRNFSSGMKQRLRLSLALLSDVSLILLDEPTSNLDPEGVEWYNKLLRDHLNGRTIIIGSNFSEDEIAFCNAKLKLEDFK